MVGSQYSKTVLEHGSSPLNMTTLNDADGQATITGPCGDTMKIYLKVSTDGLITNASFLTSGCITSIASGSMAVKMATGQTIETARAIKQRDILRNLEGLPPESEHCALLAANTLHAAIEDHAVLSSQPWKRMYRRK